MIFLCGFFCVDYFFVKKFKKVEKSIYMISQKITKKLDIPLLLCPLSEEVKFSFLAVVKPKSVL